MNQPTLRPAVVPGRPRLTGFRAACLALLSWCALPAALVHAAPIAPTTIGFDSISGAIGNYYNGGEGPNVGIESTFPAVGGWLDDQTNPTLNVPSGFTTGFAVVWNVRDGMRIRIFDGLNGSGTELATQNFFGTSGTASLPFSGTARSVRLERFGQPDFLGYDNLTFGSTTVGTPVSEPPAVTTSAATGVTSATATLNATINPAGSATTAQFEYGTTPSYGSTASVTLSPNNGTTAQTVSANLSGLAASTTYYYRATAVNGVGPRNGSGLTFTTAAPPGKALHFDGANDFVNIDSARSQVSGASKLTIEMWVKPGALVGQPVLWSGSGGNYIQTDTSHSLFLIFNGIGQVRWNKSSFFTPGVWQHVAMVFDGSLPDASRWRVYKDGALVTPTSAGGMSATIPSLSGQMLLGQYSGSGAFYFPGAMDEVRIWNSARTQAEIQAFKDTEIASMPSCLIAYYKFNQGLANGANAGITTLTDIANATTENGTLNNFALTGATSNWTDGSGIAETASAYAPGVPDINLKGGSPLVTILDGTTTTGTASGTDFGSSLVGTGVARTFTLENTGTSALTVSALSFSGANAGDYAVSGITLPATVAANANTTFTVTFTPTAGGARTATVNVVNDDCDESNYDFALTGTGTVNNPPTVARDAATVTVPEGTTAFNSGTFADANSDPVTITASVGTITQSTAWTHQQTLTQGGTPVQLVLDSQENLYVVNDIQNKLYKYDSSGGLVASWTVTGAPSGVAVDSANGWLYVVPRDGHRVDKFTLSGTLLTSWGSLGSGNGQFNLPVGVAVDAAGDVYVSEYFNHRIQVFSPSGTFLRKWGTAGSGNGQFSTPQGLRVSPGGTVYVADRGNNRVQYFDTAGAYLGQWGTGGTGNGQFNQPSGIGIDPGGNVVVGDIGNNRIQKFTATGTFVDKLGPSTTVGNLSLPVGTAFPPSGRSVYIADYSNGRVVKFATPGGWNWSHTPADGPAGPTTVTITATDSLGASGQTTFTLNVNNVAPTATFSRSAATANENTVTPPSVSFTGQVDPGTTDVSTGFKYSYDYNNDGTWDDGDGTYAGSLTAATKTIPASYFASPAPASLTVKGRILDKDGGLTDYTVSITVNRTPSNVTLNPSSIAENNAANATVGTLAATDPDAGNTHIFTLVTGTGNADNGSFTIDGNALKLTPSADFETKPTYLLRVRATDGGGLFFEKPLTVTITDVAENVAPTVARDAATVTVPEGTTAFNSGTFADANSDTVTITASVGTITQSGAGAWTHQQTLTQGGNPIELVLDSQENLYVVNPSLNTLYKYNSSGGLVTSWTVTGAPTGVAVDSANGWLYVVLKDGRRVDKFTLSGTLLTSWGSAGSGDGQFSGPHCVAVDAAGDVYVADSGNNRIQVFSPTGTFLRKWGSTGSGNGQFSFPQGLRISPGGTLYIADRNNNRVQYFNTAGTFLGKWGFGGSGDGQFNGPAGIGIDPAGNVVVGDHGNNRIQRFTATGTFVDKLGPSTAAGNLSLPHGTAFPPSGRSVYIADFSNGRVVKFATPGGWNWSFTPADGAAGPTTVTITATDNGSPNLSSTTTFTLNVNNVAPTIALTGAATVPNGTPYTLNLGAITDPGTDTVSAFSINWGDGNTENFTGNPASTTKTHTYATLGAKTITVTLTDEDGTVTGGTRSVTVENAAPVAGADGLNRPNTTTVAKVLKSVLLGNDSDADGDPLTLTAVGNAQPAGATVTLAGNFVVYTAPANNAGNGSFTYTLSAGAHSVTGTVTVTETSTAGGGGGTPNYLTLVPSGNDFVVTFLGVPGGSFRVQYSTSTAPPYVWNEFAPQAIYTAAPNGVFTHTDVNPPGPVRFYRAVSNP